MMRVCKPLWGIRVFLSHYSAWLSAVHVALSCSKLALSDAEESLALEGAKIMSDEEAGTVMTMRTLLSASLGVM